MPSGRPDLADRADWVVGGPSAGTILSYGWFRKIAMARRWDHEAAAEIMRSAGVEPLAPYPGYDQPWKCECHSCHRIVTPQFSNVKKSHNPCKWCSYKDNAIRQRRAHETAERLMVENGLQPLEPYQTALKPWKCPLYEAWTCSDTTLQRNPAGARRLPEVRTGSQGTGVPDS